MRPSSPDTPEPRLPPPYVRFTFDPRILFDEVRCTLQLARIAAISLHGAQRVGLEVRTRVDPDARAIAIDTSTECGRAVSLIFDGYVAAEYGSSAISVTRVAAIPQDNAEVKP